MAGCSLLLEQETWAGAGEAGGALSTTPRRLALFLLGWQSTKDSQMVGVGMRGIPETAGGISSFVCGGVAGGNDEGVRAQRPKKNGYC